MKYIFSVLFIFIQALFFSQEVTSYPNEQTFYKDGEINFYKEFHEELIKGNFKPCQNKNELLLMTWIVFNDGTVKYAKDQDSLSFKENKCSFDITKSVFKNLKNWNPVSINGKKSNAIVKRYIFLDALFENYKNDYHIIDYYNPPSFPGGMKKFSEEISKVVDFRDWKLEFNKRYNISFRIDRLGKICDLIVDPPMENKEVQYLILRELGWTKSKWQPATLHGVAVDSEERFFLPLELERNLEPDDFLKKDFPNR